MRIVITRILVVLSSCLALGLPGSSVAAQMEVTNEADLNSNDSIDWGQLGVANAGLANPSLATSKGGLASTISTSGNFIRLDQQQANSNIAWSGNFMPGDHLLYTTESNITVLFNAPVAGVGAQIMSDFTFDGQTLLDFTARIDVYDGGLLLDTFTESGVATDLADGSAIFLGANNTTADITSIVFSINAPANRDFAIDTLELNTNSSQGPSPGGTPEPGSLAFVISGIGVFTVLYRRPRPRRGSSA